MMLIDIIKRFEEEGVVQHNFLKNIVDKKAQVTKNDLKTVIKAVKWIGPAFSLKQRIISIFQRSNSMSIRECKRLRKIIRTEYANKKIDYNKLGICFPGKSIEVLKATYLKMFKHAKDPDAETVLTTKQSKHNLIYI